MNVTFTNPNIAGFFQLNSSVEPPVEEFKEAATKPLVEGNFIRTIQEKMEALATLAEDGKVGTSALNTITVVGGQLAEAYKDYVMSLSDDGVEDIQRDGYAITCLQSLKTIYLIACSLV